MITTELIKELRGLTGIGISTCKEALIESQGDIPKAIEYLRQKGIGIDKPMRSTQEGIIDSYIHTGGKVGVLIEVNCETDFVARCDEFKGLVHDLGLQIIACPNVSYISVEDIPPSVSDKERDIEMGREDLNNKPPAIKEKIVNGRIDKRLKELSLLDQPYIKDPTISIRDLIKQYEVVLGERVKVKRFTRYTLGES